MRLRLIVASLFVAGTAYAQAPGDYAPAPMGPGGYAPSPCGCGGDGSTGMREWMVHRWAVGLSVGSMSLHPKGDDSDASKTDFGIGQLSLRYRATLHIDIEGTIGGGRQKLQDGTDGDLEARTATIGLRYRFRPTERWNWWLSGALGMISVAYFDATDQERQDAQRPLGSLGLGIERRFTRFALQAELKAVGLGEPRSGFDKTAPVATSTNMLPPPGSSTPMDQTEGGQLTIGASYYF
jgi:hypothetical protein